MSQNPVHRGYFGIGVEGISKPMNLGAVLRTAHAFHASFCFTIGACFNVRDVLASDKLAEGERVVVEDGRSPVMLYRAAGKIYAVEDWCPHAGGPLSEGPIHNCVVTCPWHGSRFDVRDGAPLTGPASAPLRTFDVREEAGRILIKPNYEGRDWPDPPNDPREAPEHIAATDD